MTATFLVLAFCWAVQGLTQEPLVPVAAVASFAAVDATASLTNTSGASNSTTTTSTNSTNSTGPTAKAGTKSVSFTLGLVGVTAEEFAPKETAYKTAIESLTGAPASNIKNSFVEKLVSRRLLQDGATILSVQTTISGIDDAAAIAAQQAILDAKTAKTLADNFKSIKDGLEVIVLVSPTSANMPDSATLPLSGTPNGFGNSPASGTYDPQAAWAPAFPWSDCCQPLWSACCPYKQETVSCCQPTWSPCCPYSQSVFSSCYPANSCGFTPVTTYYDSPYYTYSPYVLSLETKDAKVGSTKLGNIQKEIASGKNKDAPLPL